ncbi:MAG: type 4a pilus biogenesis protein PilO [Pseudomonadales bacterium]
MIREHTLAMPRNNFLMIVSLLLLVVLAASVVYGVLPKYKQWNKVSHSLQLLSDAAALPVDMNVQILQLEQKVADLERKLSGDSASLPSKQFESHIIGQLQKAAWQYSLQLEGIKPSQGEKVDRFRETLFEVTLSGGYFAIHDLLGGLREKLGFVVVKRFNVKPGSDADSKHLDVDMVLASYRLEDG